MSEDLNRKRDDAPLEVIMKRFVGTFVAVLGLVFASEAASAQERRARAGRTEVTARTTRLINAV